MASTNIGEMFIDLVIDAGKGELTLGSLVTKMGDLELASVGEIAILAKLAQTLESLTAGEIEHALHLSHLTETTNESTESFEKWGRLASILGHDSKEIQSAMKGLDDMFGDLAQGSNAAGNAIFALNSKGLSLRGMEIHTGGDLFNAIRNDPKFQSWDKGTQASVLRLAGISDSLTPILSQKITPQSKINEINREIGPGMTDAQRKKVKELDEQFNIASQKAKDAGRGIVGYFTDVEIWLLKLATILENVAGWLGKAYVHLAGVFLDPDDEKNRAALSKQFKPATDVLSGWWERLKKSAKYQFVDSGNWDYLSRRDAEKKAPEVHFHTQINVPVTTKADPKEITGHIIYHSAKHLQYEFNKLNLQGGFTVL